MENLNWVQQGVLERINSLRRNIILHSVIYYQLNDNVWTDEFFDERCKELVELQTNYPDISKLGEYAWEFKDFAGETTYHLLGIGNVPKAQYILDLHYNKGGVVFNGNNKPKGEA